MLWMVVACGAAVPRQKRTLSWLFPSDEPEKKYPLYKVHRYTGIHVYPIVPGQEARPHSNQDVPLVEGNPPDILEIPADSGDDYNEEPSALVSLGSLASLLPAGSGILSSALGVSGGSAGGDGRSANERIGLSSKKNILYSLAEKKKGLVTGLASGVFNKVVSKSQAAKNAVKNVFAGGSSAQISGGIYHQIPVVYPRHPGFLTKIPVIGKYFGPSASVVLPEISLPYLPHLVAVNSPPNLPYLNLPTNYELPFKTGAYVKVKVPRVGKYEIPSTSYGTPANLVPVPENVPEYSPPVDVSENEVVQPTTVPPSTSTVESYPYPAQVPEVPQFVPPPPPLPQPPSEVHLLPYPPAKPSGPYPSEDHSGPYPPEKPSAPSPAPSYPYPPETFPYPPSGFYETASSEHHEVKVRPEDARPVYRHSEEARADEHVEQEPVDFVLAQVTGDPTGE